MLLKRRLNIEHLIGNQWEVNTDRIIEIVNNINEYQKFRIDSYFSKTRWRNICGNIVSVLYVWKGNTYVGTRKSKKIEKSFQLFYVELVSLTESIINDQWKTHKYEKEFARAIKYVGNIYRYIGSSNSNNKDIVLPVYNNIYVSWSKEEESSYIKSKLYGPITWISTKTTDENFGLDIENFQEYCKRYYHGNYLITRGNEREVVFLTHEEYIRKIKIIEYDEDDNKIVRVVQKTGSR